MRRNSLGCISLALLSLLGARAHAADAYRLEVRLDVSAVADDPEMIAWGEQAKKLIEEWYPRLRNLMQTPGFEPPERLAVALRDMDGVAHASGATIVVSTRWIKQHPEDIGLVLHELCHVIQNYRHRVPSWVTEGIADYYRWAIYEGKPQSWFRRPDKERGYRDSYRVAGGFFLWLEAEKAPGIVARLNTKARQGEYSHDLFKDITGQSLDELWDEYRQPSP